jgi:hypothetical protein
MVLYLLMHSRRVLVGLAVAVLFVSGCATAQAPDPWNGLTVNMTAEQVRALLGQPAVVRPRVSPQGPAEVWIYRRAVSEGVDLVATGTQEIPATNPLTGQQTTVLEPVYSQESRTVEKELQLLLFDGRLVTWKRADRTKREYQ